MKQILATVVSNTELMPGCCLLCVKVPDIAIAARPGQFVMIRCGEKLILRRPISIHRVTEAGEVYLLFNVVWLMEERQKHIVREAELPVGKGEGTLWLSQREKGQKLDLLGPLGNGFTVGANSNSLLLVAGGIGIAPLVFLAEWALCQGKSVRLLLGARTKEGLYPEKLLPKGIEVELVTEDGSVGKKGMVSEHLTDCLDWADQIYACGPKDMHQAIDSQMREIRARRPIQVSLEARMGCGIGACYGCSIPTKHGMKRVCLEGPVFNLDEVLLQEVRL